MATTIGFDHANVSIVDKDTEQIIVGSEGLSETGVFRIDAKTSAGVISANITGLAPTQTKIWGSNQMVDISAQGTGSVSLTLAANDIPDEILAKLSGMKQDEATGAWYLDKNAKAPYAAIEMVTAGTDGKPFHLALYKGMFAPEEHNLQTNNEQQTRATDSVTFSAISRNSDGRIYGQYKEDGTTATEAKILADVFAGYKPTEVVTPS